MIYKFNKLYDYPRSMRTLVGGKRHYDIRPEGEGKEGRSRKEESGGRKIKE